MKASPQERPQASAHGRNGLGLALHGLVDLLLDDRADRGLELVHVVEQRHEVILFEQPVDAGSVISLQSTLPIPGMFVT
jgi:hypothetical protein